MCVLASSPEEDQFIAELLQRMSLEEKVGQMTQVDSGMILSRRDDGSRFIDPAKLKTAIHQYKVSSIFNTIGRSHSVDMWHEWLKTIQDEALKTPNKIPVLYGIDSIHGANYVTEATLFPHNIGLGAARDPQLVRETARVTARETRAAGIAWNFDPVLDIARNPLWPRFEECYSEDSYLVSQMGVAAVQGYESEGIDGDTAVASSIKHFVGYGHPVNGKDRSPVWLSDKMLWEVHLPPFKHAINAGASTIMVHSGTVNGVPVHGDRYMLTEVLRDLWGFKGLIVSDWEDVIRLHTWHRVADTPEEAVKQAVDAGLDMSMVPNDYSFFEHLVALVKRGEVSEERVNRSVENVLRLKYRLGLFRDAYPKASLIKNVATKQAKALALDAARESMTLLKNEGALLPLNKKTKVLLAGPGADSVAALNGAWSYSWQGEAESLYPEEMRTLAETMREYTGESLTSIAVKGYDDLKNTDTQALAKAAEKVDVIVLALGENAYAESPGDIDDLRLPERQIALAQAAVLTGKPVVVVLLQGRPRIVREIEPGVAAFVLAYRPGSQGAQAITDVLYGNHNPSGRLSFSYPRFSGDILPYDHQYSARTQERSPGLNNDHAFNPQWEFGHGLSYTSFAFSQLRVSKTTFTADDTLEVSVKVKNTGKRSGKVAVDLFVTDHFAAESPAVKRLKRFSKVAIKPGRSTKVTFQLTPEDFAYVKRDLTRVTEAGTFTIHVEDQSVDVTFQGQDKLFAL